MANESILTISKVRFAFFNRQFVYLSVSGNVMRPFIILISTIILCGCVTKKQQDIFIVPFERGYGHVNLNLDTIKNEIVFSNDFWKHFTSTFPSATITIFTRQNDSDDNVIKLSDSSYTYGLISNQNQLFLRNCLPKNLSKEESESYREGLGFFVLPYPNSQKNDNHPEVTLERHWSKASETVENEYLQFYSLVTNLDKEYAIIAKKTLIDSIMHKYQ